MKFLTFMAAVLLTLGQGFLTSCSTTTDAPVAMTEDEEVLSRSSGKDYMTSLLDNNTYIDIDPAEGGTLGNLNKLSERQAKTRVVLYRVYMATEVVNNQVHLNATPQSLNISERSFEHFRKMLEEDVNGVIRKLAIEGNTGEIKNILAQLEPERQKAIIGR